MSDYLSNDNWTFDMQAGASVNSIKHPLSAGGQLETQYGINPLLSRDESAENHDFYTDPLIDYGIGHPQSRMSNSDVERNDHIAQDTANFTFFAQINTPVLNTGPEFETFEADPLRTEWQTYEEIKNHGIAEWTQDCALRLELGLVEEIYFLGRSAADAALASRRPLEGHTKDNAENNQTKDGIGLSVQLMEKGMPWKDPNDVDGVVPEGYLHPIEIWKGLIGRRGQRNGGKGKKLRTRDLDYLFPKNERTRGSESMNWTCQIRGKITSSSPAQWKHSAKECGLECKTESNYRRHVIEQHLGCGREKGRKRTEIIGCHEAQSPSQLIPFSRPLSVPRTSQPPLTHRPPSQFTATRRPRAAYDHSSPRIHVSLPHSVQISYQNIPEYPCI